MTQRLPLYWVDPVMRFGYAARGVVYVVVGGLALVAARDHTQAPDSKSALGTLIDKPFGEILLGVMAFGLAAYAGWRLLSAVLDLEDKGGELKGWAARSAQLISAVLHLSLCISVVRLIFRTEDGAGSDATESWTATIMAEPFGRWLIAISGVVAIAMGIQHFLKAHQEKYRDHLRYTPMAARLAPVIKFGIVAHGVVVIIIGAFLVWAAWTSDATRAGGLSDALNALRTIGIGQIGLAVIAAGLVGFSVYCFIEAIYRVVPRCAPEGLATLASKARELADEAQRKMADAVG